MAAANWQLISDEGKATVKGDMVSNRSGERGQIIAHSHPPGDHSAGYVTVKGDHWEVTTCPGEFGLSWVDENAMPVDWYSENETGL